MSEQATEMAEQPARSTTDLVAAVEARIQDDEELSGFGGHADWIREQVTA